MSYLRWNSGCGGDLITLTAVEEANRASESERERKRVEREMRRKRYVGLHGVYYLSLYSIF